MENLRKIIIRVYGFLILLFTVIGVVGYFKVINEFYFGGINLLQILPVIIGVPLLIGTIVILIDNNVLLTDIRNSLKKIEKEKNE